jgi:hypothetical protein
MVAAVRQIPVTGILPGRQEWIVVLYAYISICIVCSPKLHSSRVSWSHPAPPPLPHYDADMQPPRSLLGEFIMHDSPAYGNGGGKAEALDRCIRFARSWLLLVLTLLQHGSLVPQTNARALAVGFVRAVPLSCGVIAAQNGGRGFSVRARSCAGAQLAPSRPAYALTRAAAAVEDDSSWA